MHFKGHHADKIRMEYKAEGYVLQTDALFRKGYTCQIFMCNYPVSNTYFSKRLSSLDARVMDLFGTVEVKHHQC